MRAQPAFSAERTFAGRSPPNLRSLLPEKERGGHSWAWPGPLRRREEAQGVSPVTSKGLSLESRASSPLNQGGTSETLRPEFG